MAVAELQVEVAALHRGAIADAVDFEVAGKAGRDAGHHVVDQRPRRAPHRPRPLAVVLRRDRDGAVGDGRGHVVADDEAQRAEPPFGGQGLAGQIDGHALRDRDRVFADTGHIVFLIPPGQNTRHSTSPPTLAARASLSDMTPARGRQDRDPEPVIDARQVADLRIDAPPRFRDPRDLADHRLAIDVFQLDLELGDAGPHLLAREAADIALALQHVEHVGAEIRGRRRDDGLPRALAVADAGQHVGEGIAHRHGAAPYQLDFSTPGICPAEASSRIAMRDILNLR